MRFYDAGVSERYQQAVWRRTILSSNAAIGYSEVHLEPELEVGDSKRRSNHGERWRREVHVGQAEVRWLTNLTLEPELDPLLFFRSGIAQQREIRVHQ